MRKFIFTKLCVACFTFFATISHAQDGYTYTLINNGGNSFSIGAVPDASSSNFQTSVAQYGFTILLPDGVTATLTSSFGGTAGAIFFDGSNVGVNDKDGYLIADSLPNGAVSLPAPADGTTTVMATIQVEGDPTSGAIELLANDSSLATTVTALKSFIQADMTDDSTANFTNVIPEFDSGLSGDTSFSFEPLSIGEIDFVDFSVFPNPVQDSFTIASADAQFDTIKLYNIAGALVQDISPNKINNPIDINYLQSGIYFLQMTVGDSSKTLKLVKR